MKKVQAKWQELALALHIESEVENIEASTNVDPSSACHEIFTTWLRGGYRGQVTWKTLLEALQDCDFFGLARTVRVALLSREA